MLRKHQSNRIRYRADPNAPPKHWGEAEVVRRSTDLPASMNLVRRATKEIFDIFKLLRSPSAQAEPIRGGWGHRCKIPELGERSSPASLRLVHGGVRHARSEGGEGAAAGVGDITGLSGASVGQEDLAVARRSRNHALLWHYRFTAYICQSPGTPLSVWLPRSAKSNPEPATKSLTVLDTSTSPARASEATRAPM